MKHSLNSYELFGGTAQARAQEPSAMVKALAGIDFGALDDSISNLEKRLSMRIDSDYSWDWFAADNNSMLVSRFTRVFIEGSASTGEAGLVGDLVSQSTTNLLGLRQRRQISAGVMRSVSYGLLIAMIIALNITTSIIAGLGETIAQVAQGLVDAGGEVGTAAGGVDVALPVLSETGGVEQNIQIFQILGSALIVISIVVLGLITARIKGGGTSLVLGQMIQMMWVAGLANAGAAWVLERLLSDYSGNWSRLTDVIMEIISIIEIVRVSALIICMAIAAKSDYENLMVPDNHWLKWSILFVFLLFLEMILIKTSISNYYMIAAILAIWSIAFFGTLQ